MNLEFLKRLNNLNMCVANLDSDIVSVIETDNKRNPVDVTEIEKEYNPKPSDGNLARISKDKSLMLPIIKLSFDCV